MGIETRHKNTERKNKLKQIITIKNSRELTNKLKTYKSERKQKYIKPV